MPRQVEGMDAGSPGLGHVRLPVSAELVRRPLHDLQTAAASSPASRPRAARSVEAARCLDQRLALARHGGQMGRVRAVLLRHRAGLGDHGLRPLAPVAQGVERRGTLGAVRRQRVRPCGATSRICRQIGLAPGMIVEPRGDNFLRARRQLRLPGERLRLRHHLAVARHMERLGPVVARLSDHLLRQPPECPAAVV